MRCALYRCAATTAAHMKGTWSAPREAIYTIARSESVLHHYVWTNVAWEMESFEITTFLLQVVCSTAVLQTLLHLTEKKYNPSLLSLEQNGHYVIDCLGARELA